MAQPKPQPVLPPRSAFVGGAKPPVGWSETEFQTGSRKGGKGGPLDGEGLPMFRQLQKGGGKEKGKVPGKKGSGMKGGKGSFAQMAKGELQPSRTFDRPRPKTDEEIQDRITEMLAESEGQITVHQCKVGLGVSRDQIRAVGFEITSRGIVRFLDEDAPDIEDEMLEKIIGVLDRAGGALEYDQLAAIIGGLPKAKAALSKHFQVSNLAHGRCEVRLFGVDAPVDPNADLAEIKSEVTDQIPLTDDDIGDIAELIRDRGGVCRTEEIRGYWPKVKKIQLRPYFDIWVADSKRGLYRTYVAGLKEGVQYPAHTRDPSELEWKLPPTPSAHSSSYAPAWKERPKPVAAPGNLNKRFAASGKGRPY